MVWSNPPVTASNSVLTAAYLNTYLRDNFLESMPAKATTVGQTFSTVASNEIRVVTQGTARVTTSQTTSSTTYTNLATVGPSVTVDAASFVSVLISGELSNNGVGLAYISYEISGATTYAADDAHSLMVTGTNTKQFSIRIPHTDFLNPGSNTFTLKYRSTTGTATFANRSLHVISL